ncbi:Chromobox -like protein 2, partial [Trichinella britovi]
LIDERYLKIMSTITLWCHKDSTCRMAEENGDVFMAECIMNERVRNLRLLMILGKKEYLVRWEGYSEKYDSWEPAKHILGKELFAEFKKAKENGFKNAHEYNKHKGKKISKAVKKSTKKLPQRQDASSAKNATAKLPQKYKSCNIKHKKEPSDNDKQESTPDENPEVEGKQMHQVERLFCEHIRKLPLSSTESGQHTGIYSRSNLTIGEFETKADQFLRLLRTAATSNKTS